MRAQCNVPKGTIRRTWASSVLSCRATPRAFTTSVPTLTSQTPVGYSLYNRSSQSIHTRSSARLTKLQAAGSGIWTPGSDSLGPAGQAAARLHALMQALNELPDEVLAGLVGRVPGVAAAPPQEVRAKLEAIASTLRISLVRAAKLVSKVPQAWNRSPEALMAKLQPLAEELKVDLATTSDLLTAVPSLFSINQAAMVRDRIEALAVPLGVRTEQMTVMLGRQPMLWSVKPGQVQGRVIELAGWLGTSEARCIELVTKLPVLLAVEQRLIRTSLDGLCALLGINFDAAADLVRANIGLVAVPAEAVASGVEGLAEELGVGVETVLLLLTQQPTLLCTQVSNLHSAMDLLSSSLRLTATQALQLLIAQPALLYDLTPDNIRSRADSLAHMFDMSVQDVTSVIIAQPALLAISPATIKSGLAAFTGGLGRSLQDSIQLLVDDPGSFVMAGYAGGVVQQWAQRLELPAPAVAALISQQPSLLEITANTVKARLESLAALFGCPLEVAAQLMIKHPALAIIPPNATITKAKNLSMGTGQQMQTAAGIIAKQPVLLAVPPAALRPHADAVLELAAVYEFYTLDWLQQQAKEQQPQRQASFASIHGQ